MTVAPETANSKIYGHTVSDLQEDVTVTGNKISGKLKYVSEGQLPDYWGAGYFLALKFTGADAEQTAGATSILVGLKPSQGSGLVELLGDPDQNCAAKITNPSEQKFIVKTLNDTYTKTQTFDLSGLVLLPAEE